MPELTQERLKELLHYDPETGVFRWLVRTGNRAKVGYPAGSLCGGYVEIGLYTKRYKAHSLAWLWMTGCWPVDQIDHRDMIGTNNRWGNLREATNSLNRQNQRHARRDNKTGMLGVTRASGRRKFLASIKVSGKQHYLGTYETAEHAYAMYLDAKRRLHPFNTL